MFTLNVALALNLLILFAVLFFKKNNPLPNKILALLLLDTAISFLGNASLLGGYFTNFPYLFFLSWCTSSLFGPLAFSYIAIFTGKGISLKHPLWIAACLSFIFGLSFFGSYLFIPAENRQHFARSLLREPLPWQMGVINILAMLLIWGSLFFATRNLLQYRKRLMSTLSSLDKAMLSFISRFLVLLYILTLATTILYLTLPQYLVEYLYLPALITLIYLYILIYSIREHALFSAESYSQFLQDTLPARNALTPRNESSSPPATSELKVLADKILQQLKDAQLYTNPALTIGMLARALRTPVEKVSLAINRELGKNFFDLINELRVERAKVMLLEDSPLLKIEIIGARAGFNSRAAFYRAFKKSTSMTPSQYLAQSQPGIKQ